MDLTLLVLQFHSSCINWRWNGNFFMVVFCACICFPVSWCAKHIFNPRQFVNLNCTSKKPSWILQDPETKKPRVKIYVDKETGRVKGDALVTYLKVIALLCCFTWNVKQSSFLSLSICKFCMLGTLCRFGSANFGWGTVASWGHNSYVCQPSQIWTER